MKKVKLLFLLLFIIFTIGLLAKIGSFYKNKDISKNKMDFIHPQKFYNEGLFQLGVEQVTANGSNINYHIHGGVIPHDIFPGFMIADFFNSLVKQNPKTIVILGPNHQEKGDFAVITSNYGWNTAFGVVEPDKELIKKILNSDIVGLNKDLLTNEHAVAAIMPFIEYYLPDAKVVPLIISGLTTSSDIDSLLKNLVVDDFKNYIFVVSVDFSHYLNKNQADENDIQTIKYIEDYNYQKLLSLNNDYLDSPAAIVAVLRIMKQIGKTNIKTLHHKNLQDLTTEDVNQTSSYYTLVFY
ncbi:AmmeMemoRadiSam system protein B [Patescibacteria group bacterium]